MYYVSTRNKEDRRTAAEAIAQGLAVDGGLMRGISKAVPQRPGHHAGHVLSAAGRLCDELLSGRLHGLWSVGKFVGSGGGPTYCLELWHGPTCALALQMLPHLLSASLVKNQEEKTVCILVATSGDTGKAALEGFKDVDKTRILVFYPKDGVSAIQELQMNTQEGTT